MRVDRVPVPKKPGTGKRMTIAAGMLCVDGVAIAADTKEGYGETHTYVDKLTVVKRDAWKGIIAGAGDGYLLDFITPHIEELFDKRLMGYGDFQAALSGLMSDLYESRAIKLYPVDKASDLYTQFLVGAKLPNDPEAVLFVINSTLVTRATKLGTVIGCGPLREVGEEFGQVSPFGIDRAREAALCIVHEAKRRYSDVGGNTQIACISNLGQTSWHAGEEISRKEELLDRVRTMTNLLTVSVVDSSLPAKHFNGLLQNVQGRLRGYHDEARRIGKEAGRTERTWLRKMYEKGKKQHLKRSASET